MTFCGRLKFPQLCKILTSSWLSSIKDSRNFNFAICHIQLKSTCIDLFTCFVWCNDLMLVWLWDFNSLWNKKFVLLYSKVLLCWLSVRYYVCGVSKGLKIDLRHPYRQVSKAIDVVPLCPRVEWLQGEKAQQSLRQLLFIVMALWCNAQRQPR